MASSSTVLTSGCVSLDYFCKIFFCEKIRSENSQNSFFALFVVESHSFSLDLDMTHRYFSTLVLKAFRALFREMGSIGGWIIPQRAGPGLPLRSACLRCGDWKR